MHLADDRTNEFRIIPKEMPEWLGLVDIHRRCIYNGTILFSYTSTKTKHCVEGRHWRCQCLRKGPTFFFQRVTQRVSTPILSAACESGSHRPLVWKRSGKWSRQVHLGSVARAYTRKSIFDLAKARLVRVYTARSEDRTIKRARISFSPCSADIYFIETIQLRPGFIPVLSRCGCRATACHT